MFLALTVSERKKLVKGMLNTGGFCRVAADRWGEDFDYNPCDYDKEGNLYIDYATAISKSSVEKVRKVIEDIIEERKNGN